jgi:hypothetical protein
VRQTDPEREAASRSYLRRQGLLGHDTGVTREGWDHCGAHLDPLRFSSYDGESAQGVELCGVDQPSGGKATRFEHVSFPHECIEVSSSARAIRRLRQRQVFLPKHHANPHRNLLSPERAIEISNSHALHVCIRRTPTLQPHRGAGAERTLPGVGCKRLLS